METLRTITAVIASLFILFGYLRFITNEKGNVDLNSYRFTGGIQYVLMGMVEGTWDLISRELSSKAISALSIYIGALVLYCSFQ